MSQPLISGFSPYNVPIKPGKRLGVEPRVASEHGRVQPQAKASGRWSQPAVDVRLSQEALAFLNGGGGAKPQTATLKPVLHTGFDAALDEAGGAVPLPADAPHAAEQPYARYVAPGSKVDILV